MTHRESFDRRHTLSRRQSLKLLGGAGMVIPAAALAGPHGASAAGSGLNRLLRAAYQAEPVQGGSVTVVTEADWVDLNPHKNGLFAGLQAYEYIYESLTRFDADMNVQPALAESWENPDPLTWIFHLRPGVTWHDGTPFTAADVKYSWDRIQDPETGASFRSNLSVITATEIVDELTVKVTLSAPRVFLLETIANLAGSTIIPDGAGDAIADSPNGTGPFRVGEVRTGDFIRFERNADYWDAPHPYLDELILKLMVEEDTRVAWIRGEQADNVDLYAEAAARLEGEDEITVLEYPKVYMLRIQYNCAEGPTADPKVRLAMDMALDRFDMIDKARFGGATLTGIIPSGLAEWEIPTDELPAWFSTPDIEGAKALMAEADYADGFSIGIKGSRPEHIAIALVAQQNWKEIGIEAEVIQMEYGTYIDDALASNFETLVIGQTFNPDPLNYVVPLFRTDGSSNRPLYSNPEVDAMLDQASQTTDREELKQILRDVQFLIWETGTPQSYVYNALGYEGMRNRVQGYAPRYSARRTGFVDAWVTE